MEQLTGDQQTSFVMQRGVINRKERASIVHEGLNNNWLYFAFAVAGHDKVAGNAMFATRQCVQILSPPARYTSLFNCG